MKRFLPLLIILPLSLWISCGGEKYDHIKEGQRFNKNTGEVEYKTDKGWMLEEEYKKHKNKESAEGKIIRKEALRKISEEYDAFMALQNSMNRVRDVLKNISMASKMYNQTYNEITFDIKLLEESGQLAIDKEIKDLWKFYYDAKGTLLTAESINTYDGRVKKIHYNLQTGSYE